ncbi:MAG: PadR family transcriptional regulator [Nonomuraea sp.]|nr:PadR family transcriptional regulator [Nonomuraea sp.]
MTRPTLSLIEVFLAEPEREFYGLELREVTGLPNGTLYPRLAQLEAWGWLESRREDTDSDVRAGRPPRRYYRLTQEGAVAAREQAERARRSHGLRARPAQGA